ncbi:MAG: hypothetical protein ACI4B6_04075 [Atopobiaceae bacterium]
MAQLRRQGHNDGERKLCNNDPFNRLFSHPIRLVTGHVLASLLPAKGNVHAGVLWHPHSMPYYVSHTIALVTLGAIAARNGKVRPSYEAQSSTVDASISARGVHDTVLPLLAAICGCTVEEFSRQRVDLIFSSDLHKHHSSNVVPHRWSAPLPPGSFLHLSDDVRLSSVEFVFLQMAGTLSFTELVLLGYSLCGTYQPADIERGFIHRPPLTSVDRLRRYLGNVTPGTRGLKKALRALDCIVDGSNSPMETRSVMQLVLPASLGGFGLPHPQMNQRIDFGSQAQKVSKLPYCVADAVWPKVKYVLEYLGLDYHDDAGRDVGRSMGLTCEGFVVQEVTSEQVKGTGMVEIAEKLRERLQPRGTKATSPKTAKANRPRLLTQLFPPAQRTGDGSLVYPKPAWALPAGFPVCVEQDQRYQALRQAQARHLR